eukprot:612514-Amphidinium_carterae.4
MLARNIMDLKVACVWQTQPAHQQPGSKIHTCLALFQKTILLLDLTARRRPDDTATASQDSQPPSARKSFHLNPILYRSLTRLHDSYDR